MNCSECKYSCKRNHDNDWRSENSISADCDLTCAYDIKTDMYVNDKMVCKHFSNEGKIDWNKRHKREYPIERV